MSFEQDCSCFWGLSSYGSGCCTKTVSLVEMSIHSLDGYRINPNWTASGSGMTFFRGHLSAQAGYCIVTGSHSVISNTVADYSLFGPGQVT